MSHLPTIRPALPSDASGLDALRASVLATHHAARPDLFRPEPIAADSMENVSRECETVVLVAEIEGDVVGFIEGMPCVTENHPVLADRRAFKIDTLVVDEAWRGRGIGRQLVLAMEGAARDMGIREFELNVYAFNEAAKGLYGSLGYEPLNVRLAKSE